MDSGYFLVKIPKGLGLKDNKDMAYQNQSSACVPAVFVGRVTWI